MRVRRAQQDHRSHSDKGDIIEIGASPEQKATVFDAVSGLGDPVHDQLPLPVAVAVGCCADSIDAGWMDIAPNPVASVRAHSCLILLMRFVSTRLSCPWVEVAGNEI